LAAREGDPPQLSAGYGAGTPILDWRERLVYCRCGSLQVERVVSGTGRMRIVRFARPA